MHPRSSIRPTARRLRWPSILIAALIAAPLLPWPAPGTPAIAAAPAATWRQVAVLEGSRPSLSLDDAGRAHVALYGPEGPAGAEMRYVAEAQGWAPEAIDGPEDIGASTAIAVAGDIPHVAYDFPRYGVRYATPTRSGSWARHKVEASNPSGTQVGLAVGPSGQPYIGFHSAADKDWRHGPWSASREAFVLRTSSIGDIGRFGGVAVDDQGAYHFTYYDTSSKNVYYERGAPDRANDTLLERVDVIARIALRLGPDDYAQLAIPTGEGVVWAIRDDDGWSTEPVPGADSVTHVSMAIDADGVTHVVWADGEGDLTHASRGDDGWSSAPLAGARGGPLALAAREDRLVLAVDEPDETRVVILEATTAPPATAAPPTPTRVPSPTPTAGPTPTLAPAALDLWLSAGCDRSYAPGTILFARFGGTRTGRIIVDHAPAGPRPLYDGPLVAGRPWATALGVAGQPGRRTLVARMPEHGLEASCRYDVVER